MSYTTLRGRLCHNTVLNADEIIGVISVNIDVIDQLLIRCSVFVKYWRKSGSILGQYISYL